MLQKRCPVKDVVLGRHLLTPHFMMGLDLTAKGHSPDPLAPNMSGPVQLEKKASRESLGKKSTNQDLPVSGPQSPIFNEVQTPRSSGKSSAQSLSGSGGKCPVAVLSMQTRYNAVWNKLEQDCVDNPPESECKLVDPVMILATHGRGRV